MRRPDGESHRGALPRRRHPLRGAWRVRLRRGTVLAPRPRGRNRQLHEGEPHVLRLCLGNGTRHRNPRRRRRTPHRGPLSRVRRWRSLPGDRRRTDSHARQRYEEARVRRRRRGSLATQREDQDAGADKVLSDAWQLSALGSAGIRGAWLAAGYLDVSVGTRNTAWDYAPTVLLVTEAGGSATDLSGEPWSLSSEGLIATNGILHDEVLETLHRA